MGLDLTVAAQVAQMVVVRASGHLFDHQIQYPDWEPLNADLTHWIRDLNVGGVIFLGGSAAEIGLRTQHLQDFAATPLLMAADIEEGVGQRFSGATWFPPPMAIAHIARHDLPKAIAYAEAMGAATAQEAVAIGLNWVLAPVVDVNNNPKNPVINVRAFGDEPDIVGELAAAFIRGAKPFPVLTSAKHFPGHGDTATDSHLDLPVLPHDRERLAAIELPPFKAAIAAGVDTVISAHLQIPLLDASDPATLSPKILTGLLRQELGFDGLITTDALVMGAIANRYGPNEAAILAVEAGADILLMPADPEGAIKAVCKAVETGRISRDRIQSSYDRIRWAKQGIGSPHTAGDDSTTHAWENITPPPVQLDQLAQPQVRETAIAILQESMVCQVPQPLPKAQAGQNIILIDNSLDCDFLGHNAPAITVPQAHGYHQLTVVDQHVLKAKGELKAEGRRQKAEEPTPSPSQEGDRTAPTPQRPNALLQLFVRGNPFRGRAGMSDRAIDLLMDLLAQDCLQGVVVYGSPYLWDALKQTLPESVPCVFTYGQMPTAQVLAMQALFK
ncbi:MAG: glycoside hydrolase family 3 N-terminal domain-containing protein [Cyanobacteria bacterium P01_F01_bin.150]